MEQDSPMNQQSQSPSIEEQNSPIAHIIGSKVQSLQNCPQNLNSLTFELIQQINELILHGYTYSKKSQLAVPVSIVVELLNQSASEVISSGLAQDSSDINFKALLLLNTMRGIIRSTFETPEQNQQNKLIQLTHMLYGYEINKLVHKYIERSLSLGQISYGLIITDLIYFQMNKNHTPYRVCPECFRFWAVGLQSLCDLIDKEKNTKSKSWSLKIMRRIEAEREQNIKVQKKEANEKEKSENNKQVLLDKYNFSHKRTSIPAPHEKQSKSLSIIELLQLNHRFNQGQVTAVQYAKLLLAEFIHKYLKIIAQSRKLGIKHKDFFTMEISQQINARINHAKQFELDTPKKKTIYLETNNLGSKGDQKPEEDKWEAIPDNLSKNFEELLKRNNKYHKPKQEEVDEEDSFDVHKDQLIVCRELTPRFPREGEEEVLRDLRQKKRKLKKKIQADIKKATFNNIQQAKVLRDVRQEKAKKREKKEMFILEKQTQQAKKYHNKVKKIKKIEKQSKKQNKTKPIKKK